MIDMLIKTFIQYTNKIQYLYKNPLWLIKRVCWKYKEEHLLPKDLLCFGTKIIVPLPDKKYGNSRVHPCVRYMKNGFAGYKWWMVLSPYPELDEKKENILLYNCNDEIPYQWNFVKVIVDTHKQGFNSDPNLYIDKDRLWVFWRECETENVIESSDYAATFGCYTEDGISFSDTKLYARNYFKSIHGLWGDTEMCPIVIKKDEKYLLYGTYYLFEKVRNPLGISIYQSNNINNQIFELIKNVRYNFNFNYWHFDLFEYNSILYSVVTSEHGSAIYIGRSRDYINFEFSDRPLLSEKYSKHSYFYKPSVVIQGKQMFLFYPSRIKESTNIFLSSFNVEEVIKKAFDNK